MAPITFVCLLRSYCIAATFNNLKATGYIISITLSILVCVKAYVCTYPQTHLHCTNSSILWNSKMYIHVHTMYTFTNCDFFFMMKSSIMPNISNKETYCLKISLKILSYWKCLIWKKKRKKNICMPIKRINKFLHTLRILKYKS